MKTFKFLTNNNPFNPNTYEEMVLGMIRYCNNNDMNCIGYSHTFTHNDAVETVRRIVIRNVDIIGEQTNLSVRVDYDVHLIHNYLSDTITRHHFTFNDRIIQMERLY